MIFYVIRHKSTQSLLHARVLATQWDFTTPNGVFEPRLFRSERAAKNCATCWAQGEWRAEIKTESEGWEYASYEYRDTPCPTVIPGRNRDDLEILPARLEIGT